MQPIHGQFTIYEDEAAYTVMLGKEQFRVSKSPKVMYAYDVLRWIEQTMRAAERASQEQDA